MQSETASLLTKILQEKKLTKWRVSKELNVSWKTVHCWQRGVFNPNEEHLKALRKLAE